jgi:hypothetical protein
MADTERPSKRQRRKQAPLPFVEWKPSPEKTTIVMVGDGHTSLSLEEQSGIQQKPILDNDYPSSLLQNMLFPLSEKAFLENYFRQCAVHVPLIQQVTDGSENEAANRRMQCIMEQLCDLDPEQLFRETSSESIFVWLRAPSPTTNGKNSNKNKKTLINSIEVSDPDMALALYQAGNATYCRAPEAMEQKLVAALLENTGLGCGQYEENPGHNTSCGQATSMGRGEVEVFLSAVAGHLTNWHFDFQENFTVQLSGTKRWTMQKGTVKHPVRGCTPHYASPGTVEPQLKAARLADPNFEFGHPETGVNAVGEVESVLLKPGDTFYFPAGMWHKVEVIEPGVSINISLMATNYATITCQALQHLLLKQDQWRESVVRNPETGVVDHLKALLKELPKVIQDFEESGGADWIIPPVLQHGKVTRDPVDDDEEDDDDDGFREDSDEEKDEDVIDFLKFEPPAGTPLLIKDHCYIAKNPLASLISEKSITEFYDGNIPGTITHEEIYVLNVNFAGNESHESTVRVRIKDDEGRLGRFIEEFTFHEGMGISIINDKKSRSPEDWKLFECLIHFGYMKMVR